MPPLQARYRYSFLSTASLSRNSLSINDSILFFTSGGGGTNLPASCLVTSETIALWSATLRAFITRTIAASTCGLRSSSTRALVSARSGSASEREAETVPILTLKRRDAKASLTVKGVAVVDVFPRGGFLQNVLALDAGQGLQGALEVARGGG